MHTRKKHGKCTGYTRQNKVATRSNTGSQMSEITEWRAGGKKGGPKGGLRGETRPPKPPKMDDKNQRKAACKKNGCTLLNCVFARGVHRSEDFHREREFLYPMENAKMSKNERVLKKMRKRAQKQPFWNLFSPTNDLAFGTVCSPFWSPKYIHKCPLPCPFFDFDIQPFTNTCPGPVREHNTRTRTH